MNNKIVAILLLLVTAGVVYAAEDWNLGAVSTFANITTTQINGTNNILTIGDSNDNVGIGTASPLVKLHIVGTDASESGTATPNGAIMAGGVSSTAIIDIGTVSSPRHGWIQSRNNDGAVFNNLVLNPSGGNVGIGTASPDSRLVVKSNGAGELGGIKLEGYSSTNAAINLFSVDDFTGIINMTKANVGIMISLNSGGGSFINGGNFGIKNTTLPNIITVQQASDTDPIADTWTTYASDAKHKKDLTTLSKTETKYLEKAKNWTGTTWKRNGTVSREEAISVMGIKKEVISSASAFEIVPVYEDRPTGQTKITYTYNSNGDVLPVLVNVTQKVQNGTIKQLKANITFNKDNGEFYQEIPWTEAEITLKIDELMAIKQALPKYQTSRVGALIDENTPPEVLVYDNSGNVQGYDLLALVLYQGEVIRELAYQVDSLKSK